MAILDFIVYRGEEYKLIATPHPYSEELCNLSISNRDDSPVTTLISTWVDRKIEARSYLKCLERRARKEKRKAQ